jgi:ubiquinone/menaquinone biosynthesis C-methylase UbiE
MASSDFRQASRAVWDVMAGGWERRQAFLEERARPVAERMLARAAPRPGETVLDVAAGTGVVGLAAAAAVAPGGRVIVSDFSPEMVAAAERQARALGVGNAEFRVLDGERLDLEDDVADVVLCRWGYMLMGDPGAAIAEARRVLRPAGRHCCAVFGGPEGNPWAALPARVLVEAGHMPPPRSGTPGILALGDPGRLEDLFTGAGFPSPRVEEVAFTWTFRDADEYWAFLVEAAGALAMVIGRLDDASRETVRERVGRELEPFRADDRIELAATSLVATAA